MTSHDVVPGTQTAGHPPVRGTQSLVHMLTICWRRPRLIAIELAWRWGYGIPALAILAYEASKVLARVPLHQTGILNFSLEDPWTAAELASTTIGLLLPPVLEIVRWLAPLLAIGWAIASGLGRNLLLKRLDPAMRSAPLVLIVLQLVRIVALASTVIGWWTAVHWAAGATLGGAEPNLVGYCSWVICLSLGAFTLWALVSWIFSIAPLLALLEGHGVLGSLIRSLRLGPLPGKLVEVNLALGIVKLALIMLALAFSAMPLPFAKSMTGRNLYLWWAGVSVIYMAASDYFQVARLAVFVRFWRFYRPLPGSPAQ